MSKLFEALSRGGESLGELPLDVLLEGHQAATPLVPVVPASPVIEARSKELAAPRVPADLFAGVRIESMRVVPSCPIFPFDGTHVRAGEQYRSLRTRIIQRSRKPHTLLVTSAGPNDGKTVTAINIAGAMALKDNARVLLIDGDFRRSTVARKLGLPEGPGLANFLNGECALNDAIVRTAQIPNLYIIPAGQPQANPAELLDSSRWLAFCVTFRAAFDYVVIDSTPVGAVSDYDLIQAQCDGIVLVIRPDQTDRQHCMDAIKSAPKDKLLGVILNCLSERSLDKGHKYGAYYYTGNNPSKAATKGISLLVK